jgi:hypothetical protein
MSSCNVPSSLLFDPAALGEAVQQGAVPLDVAIARAWQARNERVGLRSVFRSNFASVMRKRVPRRDGSPGRFFVQCNPGRALRRAAARQFRSVCEPFDPARFHFGRRCIRADEVLMELTIDALPVSILVNVSPFGHNHFLIVVDPEGQSPQQLDAVALHAAHRVLDGSTRPDLVIGFNSLGACATVNHLHLQGVYFRGQGVDDDQMPSERAPRTQLATPPGLAELDDYPVHGWVVQGEAGSRVATTLAVVQELQRANLPHNVLLSPRNTIVMPRRHQDEVGIEASGLAFLELNGEMIITADREHEALAVWQHIVEEDVVRLLQQVAVPTGSLKQFDFGQRARP